MPSRRSQAEALADRIHSAAIHLLRRLRREDEATGLTSSRLSALSVIVHAGPIRTGELAAAEQVTAPTVSRLVAALEEEGLVRRAPDPDDARAHLIEATDAGRRLLVEGRRRRVRVLARDLAGLPPTERDALERAADILEQLNLPADHPRRNA